MGTRIDEIKTTMDLANAMEARAMIQGNLYIELNSAGPKVSYYVRFGATILKIENMTVIAVPVDQFEPTFKLVQAPKGTRIILSIES